MKICLACGKELVGRQQKYCSLICQNEHRYMLYIERWKAGKEKPLMGISGNMYKIVIFRF